jgi:hypothetical protein
MVDLVYSDAPDSYTFAGQSTPGVSLTERQQEEKLLRLVAVARAIW